MSDSVQDFRVKKSSGAFTKLENRSPEAQGWPEKQCPAGSALPRPSPCCPRRHPGAPHNLCQDAQEREESSAQEAARGGSPRRDWPDAIQTAPANVEINV